MNEYEMAALIISNTRDLMENVLEPARRAINDKLDDEALSKAARERINDIKTRLGELRLIFDEANKIERIAQKRAFERLNHGH